MRSYKRLVASDYGDRNEANFQAFLEEEAKDKLSQEIAMDIIPGYKDYDTTRAVIANPGLRKEYEAGWKSLFLKARMEPLNEKDITREMDRLFDIWNKSPKMRITFSSN